MAAAMKELTLNLFDNNEEILVSKTENPLDERFDIIVGELENILMDPEFNSIQNGFMTTYCDQFNDADENRLEYTTIFNEYANLIEEFLTTRLESRLEWFNMASFMAMLQEREVEELQGDVFELLGSLGDFEIFKEMMLATKAARNGSLIDLSDLIQIKASK